VVIYRLDLYDDQAFLSLWRLGERPVNHHSTDTARDGRNKLGCCRFRVREDLMRYYCSSSQRTISIVSWSMEHNKMRGDLHDGEKRERDMTRNDDEYYSKAHNVNDSNML